MAQPMDKNIQYSHISFLSYQAFFWNETPRETYKNNFLVVFKVFSWSEKNKPTWEALKLLRQTT